LKLLLIGDLHIDPNLKELESIDDIEELIKIFTDIKNIVLDNNIDFVVFLGDIFDSSSTLSAHILTLTISLFTDLSKMCKIIVLTGNHDIYSYNEKTIQSITSKISLLNSIKYLTNILVIEKPEICDIDSTPLIFIPYSENISKDLSSLRVVAPEYSYMFGHFNTREFEERFISKEKLESLEIQTSLLDKPSLEDLSIYKRVFLGHIHTEGEFGNLIYVGSARNSNYNDTDLVKHFYILDTSNNEVRKIENHNTQFFITLKGIPDLKNLTSKLAREKLQKANIKYQYSSIEEAEQISKFRKHFRTLTLLKNSHQTKEELTPELNKTISEIKERFTTTTLSKERVLKILIPLFKEETVETTKKVFDYMMRGKQCE